MAVIHFLKLRVAARLLGSAFLNRNQKIWPNSAPLPASFTWFLQTEQTTNVKYHHLPFPPPKTLPRAPGYKECCLASWFLMHHNQTCHRKRNYSSYETRNNLFPWQQGQWWAALANSVRIIRSTTWIRWLTYNINSAGGDESKQYSLKYENDRANHQI